MISIKRIIWFFLISVHFTAAAFSNEAAGSIKHKLQQELTTQYLENGQPFHDRAGKTGSL